MNTVKKRYRLKKGVKPITKIEEESMSDFYNNLNIRNTNLLEDKYGKGNSKQGAIIEFQRTMLAQL